MYEWEAAYNVVKCLIYSVFTLGVFLLSKEWVKFSITKIRMRHRLRTRRKLMTEKRVIEMHLTKLLAVTLGNRFSAKTFLTLLYIIFLAVFVVGLQSVSAIWAITAAAIVAAIPYVALRVKLESTRRRGSYEGERLIGEFLSQYSISKFNILETIEVIVAQGKNIKISKDLLYQLLLELRTTGNSEKIKLATERFAYGIDTNWSRMLANNIRIAAEKGIDVTGSIEDILIQLREARVAVEERKRLNSESFRMVIFLIPSLYLGTVLLSTKYLGLSMSTFLQNQFYTNQGFLLLFIILFLFGLNIVLLEFVSHQRFDF